MEPDSPSELLGAISTDNTLSSVFSAQNLQRINFYCFQPPPVHGNNSSSRKSTQPNWNLLYRVKFDNIYCFLHIGLLKYFKSIGILKIRTFNVGWVLVISLSLFITLDAFAYLFWKVSLVLLHAFISQLSSSSSNWLFSIFSSDFLFLWPSVLMESHVYPSTLFSFYWGQRWPFMDYQIHNYSPHPPPELQMCNGWLPFSI